MFKGLIFRLLNRHKCQHEKVTPGNMAKYCPDCGKPIILYWKIIRCDTCESKRLGIFHLGNFIPMERYCSKCGAEGYYTETKSKLSFFDIDYAVLIKEEAQLPDLKSKTQIWVDMENSWNNVPLKLIPFLMK